MSFINTFNSKKYGHELSMKSVLNIKRGGKSTYESIIFVSKNSSTWSRSNATFCIHVCVTFEPLHMRRVPKDFQDPRGFWRMNIDAKIFENSKVNHGRTIAQIEQVTWAWSGDNDAWYTMLEVGTLESEVIYRMTCVIHV